MVFSLGVAVFIGGGLGALLRYAISDLLPTYISIFAVNVVGSGFIGFALAFLYHQHEQCPDASQATMPLWWSFWVVGFFGGLTTFSSFSADSLKLLQSGAYKAAILYIFATVFISLISVVIGYWLAQK